MKAICAIPARLDSSRLPGKVLLNVGGKPLVCRTAEAALRCDRFSFVAVLVDDDRVAQAVFEHLIEPNQDAEDRSYWNRLVVFRVEGDYACGTDRVAAFVARNIPEEEQDLCVVNLQADEPEVSPEALSRLVELIEGGAEMATLASMAQPKYDDLNDPSRVQIVFDTLGYALAFGRDGRPLHAYLDDDETSCRNHIGAYAFTRKAIEAFASLPRSPGEIDHSLEQLRWIEAGRPIRVAVVPHEGRGVNTPADYEALVHKLRVRASVARMSDIHDDTFRKLED